MSYGADLLGVTEETFDVIKATAQSGWLAGLGVQGVNLGRLISLVPHQTPFANRTARTKPSQGSKFAYWRQLVNINNQQGNPAVGDDYAGPLVLFEEQDVFAPFIPIRATGRVTEDAIDEAGGYADALALATVQVLLQVKDGEDIHGLNSQAYPLPAITAPVVTQGATTGGTIPASTAVYVKVAARAGWNYYYGGNGPVSSAGNVTTGTTTSTNTVTGFVTAVRGAVAYDWFVGTSGTQYYYTTTTTNTVTITSVPTAAQAVPTTGLPLISSTVPTASTADGSYSSNNMNGLIASCLGDYGAQTVAGISGGNLVTPGTGVNNQGYWASNDGAALTYANGGIAAIGALNQGIYDQALLSPTRYLVSSRVAAEIGRQIMASTAATTFLQGSSQDSRRALVAGGNWGSYLNESTGGTPVEVEVQSHLPPGILIAVCDNVDYPGANIDAALRFEVQREYSQKPYGSGVIFNTSGGGPREDFDVTVRSTFELAAPPTCGVLQNCG